MAQTQIFSIFGQIEEVAANIMIERGGCQRIMPDTIPISALYNENDERAKFAIVVPSPLISEFEKLIADLRS